MASNIAVDAARIDGAEWRRLEAAVHSLLDEHVAWRRRAAEAERRIHELEAALNAMSAGRLDPVELSDQLRSYEHENRLLNERIDRAKHVVERIQARLQFLEAHTPRDMGRAGPPAPTPRDVRRAGPPAPTPRDVRRAGPPVEP